MMRTSETLGALAPALVKARAETKAYTKSRTATVSSTKGSYKYEYATLADAFDACAEAFAAHGLVLLHFIDEQSAREITVGARLLHESGEWVEDVLRFTIPEGSGPQQVGSLLTYARRYTTLNLAGLAATDDDAKSAQDASDRAHQQQRSAPHHDTGEAASDKQIGMLKGLIQRSTDEKAKAWLASGGTEGLTRQMASKMIDRLMNGGDKPRTTTTPLPVTGGDAYEGDDEYDHASAGEAAQEGRV